MNPIDRIRRNVHRMDPKLKETDDGFKVAVILMAGPEVGLCADRIARFTTYARAFVRTVCRRLRANKIWRSRKIACDWFDEKVGGVEFWCDASVGLGYLKKSE